MLLVIHFHPISLFVTETIDVAFFTEISLQQLKKRKLASTWKSSCFWQALGFKIPIISRTSMTFRVQALNFSKVEKISRELQTFASFILFLQKLLGNNKQKVSTSRLNKFSITIRITNPQIASISINLFVFDSISCMSYSLTLYVQQLLINSNYFRLKHRLRRMSASWKRKQTAWDAKKSNFHADCLLTRN